MPMMRRCHAAKVCPCRGSALQRSQNPDEIAFTNQNMEETVLHGIDPALNADLLYVLQAMGHGDDLVICDANFPADSIAHQTTYGRLIRMDNIGSPEAIRAVLSLMPLDSFVDTPAERMEVVGNPDELPAIQQEAQAAIDAVAQRDAGRDTWPMGSVERFAFYERAKKAYAIVATGERRFYGCFILKKGVIPPP
jgi:L-fucose mutarotase